MFEIEVTDKEIRELEAWAKKVITKGTRYPGSSYEEGIIDTLDFLFGRGDSPATD